MVLPGSNERSSILGAKIADYGTKKIRKTNKKKPFISPVAKD